MPARLMAAALLVAFAVPVYANEVIVYTYDAVGRVVKVVRNGVTTLYVYDKAGNRLEVKTTGSSNPPP